MLLLFMYLFVYFLWILQHKVQVNHTISVSRGQINVDGYQYWLVVTVTVSFESLLDLKYWSMYCKGRVHGRYRG